MTLATLIKRIAFLLKDAGYDRDQLQPGYKNKFVIHAHSADRAGRHWDLRLLFPVTSISKALGTYGKKREPGSGEPLEDYQDKPGFVYRSFVTKKRRAPSGDTKIYLIESENHPQQYGSFHGEITEGYGKGMVDIFDKGTFEILDTKGDKQYTIQFNGSKLKGIYAFVKYKNGYLWVKTKDQTKG